VDIAKAISPSGAGRLPDTATQISSKSAKNVDA